MILAGIEGESIMVRIDAGVAESSKKRASLGRAVVSAEGREEARDDKEGGIAVLIEVLIAAM